MNSEAFVYCWTDHATNQLYIGWHKGNFDDGYICSSKYMKEQYFNRPNDFTRQIIAVGSCKDMTNLETQLLRSADAKNDDQFYNRHNGDGFYCYGKFTEETKQKLRRPKTEEHKQKLRGPKSDAHKKAMSINHADFSGKNNPMYGRSAITENQLKWYTNGSEEVYVPEGDQPNNWYRGRKIKGNKFPERTKEHCERISKAKKGKSTKLKGYKYEKVTCPYCGAVGGGGNMTRLHFENCRNKS
jgi:hypothetical protein